MLAPEMAGAAAQRYAGGDPKFERLGGVLNQENSKSPPEFQVPGEVAERLRIARLRRQFGFDDAIAALVANLAFATTEGR